METNKVFHIACILFFKACFFSLSAQEDVSVKFSFEKPNEYVCEIKNKTDFKMDIWFDWMMEDNHRFSNAHIDLIKNRKDTIRDCYYPLKTEPPYRVRLDPGQVYSTLLKDGTTWRFIKARVYVRYSLILPASEWEARSYEKTFDLAEIRNKSLAQEDVSVEFSFKKPNGYVCEIRNVAKHRMSILLGKEEADNRSALHFDVARWYGMGKPRKTFYGLMKDDNQSRFLYLDPGQSYTVSHKDNYGWRFTKAYLHIDYVLIIPGAEPRGKSYEKTFDLQEIRDKAYRQPIGKNEE